jgi:enolase
MKIKSVYARQILDSRGNPTVEADVLLEDGSLGRGAVPSGASVGKYEAHELRDDDKTKYGGLGVLNAVTNVNDVIAHDLVGMDALDQKTIDKRMIALDGTKNKEKLGANAILAVSIGCIKAAAASSNMDLFRYIGSARANILPLPMMNIVNGGKHANNSTDFQEIMISPVGAGDFKQAMQIGLEVYYALKDIIKKNNLMTTVGDEGGFAVPNISNDQAITLVVQAIQKAGYKPKQDVAIALDLASNSFFNNGFYELKSENLKLNTAQMIDKVVGLVNTYPIYSVEDPLEDDDWEGYMQLTAKIGDKVQIVGDDLYVTNQDRLQRGINEKSSNAILIKLNQIGTVSETIDCVNLAKANNFAAIISHRSGETTDTFIADLVVGLGAGQIKTGAPARSERTSKYNQLLRIQELLGADARFASLV